jgi:hypothetical protein
MTLLFQPLNVDDPTAYRASLAVEELSLAGSAQLAYELKTGMERPQFGPKNRSLDERNLCQPDSLNDACD